MPRPANEPRNPDSALPEGPFLTAERAVAVQSITDPLVCPTRRWPRGRW